MSEALFLFTAALPSSASPSAIAVSFERAGGSGRSSACGCGFETACLIDAMAMVVCLGCEVGRQCMQGGE